MEVLKIIKFIQGDEQSSSGEGADAQQ